VWLLFFLCPFLLQWTGSANINWQRLRFCTKNITGVPVVDVNKHQRLSVRFDAQVRTKLDLPLLRLRNTSSNRWHDPRTRRMHPWRTIKTTLRKVWPQRIENDARCLFYFDSSGRVQLSLSLGARARVVQRVNPRFCTLGNRFSQLFLLRFIHDHRIDPLLLNLMWIKQGLAKIWHFPLISLILVNLERIYQRKGVPSAQTL
jgi:hypothetical protein